MNPFVVEKINGETFNNDVRIKILSFTNDRFSFNRTYEVLGISKVLYTAISMVRKIPDNVVEETLKSI